MESRRRKFTPEELDIEIPGFTFRPNVWTEAFLTGLKSVRVKNKSIVEIGVGSGIIAIDLLKRGVKEYFGIDIDSRILPIAQQNIIKKVPKSIQKVTLLQSDLLESVPDDRSFDIVCGCLPQVSKPSTIELGVDDSYARYFDSQKYQSVLNVYGLGLNEGALIQAKTRLKPQGSVILVLSGRAGKEILEQFVTENGYTPRVIFEDTIAQLRETTLETLVQAESKGYKFFFYKDPECKELITVKEAEERRLSGKESYHKIYVIEAKLD
jgi:methylase of polypeptide subunit release factors